MRGAGGGDAGEGLLQHLLGSVDEDEAERLPRLRRHVLDVTLAAYASIADGRSHVVKSTF